MKHLYSVILLTGAVTLSLELLASRILAPYFGVSLYIWTGILSITLIALAFGYWWGGRLCKKSTPQQRDQLVTYFAIMPAVSCNSLVIACLLYPKAFLAIANFDLVLGSFLACIVLLLVPLVCLSAMNPLLVALRVVDTNNSEGGDSGAGSVFFISTLGSVAGVLVTAFLLVPNMTNFRSVLLLSFILSLLAFWSITGSAQVARNRKRSVLALALLGAVSSLLLFFGTDWYLKKNQEIAFRGRTWSLVDEFPTFFGNIKIVQVSTDFASGNDDQQESPGNKYVRLYFTDACVQGTVGNDGNSQSLYTYAFESLGRGIIPRPRRILVLGLAAGSVPMRYARYGVDIDVVEINPAAAPLAQRYFQFDPTVANVINADARVYARQCRHQYDLIFFDLFASDSSTPEYLLTSEFIRDLSDCLTPEGAILFNVSSSTDARPYDALLKTVRSVLPELTTFHLDTDRVSNIIIIASRDELADLRPAPLPDLPGHLHSALTEMLSSQRAIDTAALAGVKILTDDDNPYAYFSRKDLLKYRKQLIAAFPGEFLVN